MSINHLPVKRIARYNIWESKSGLILDGFIREIGRRQNRLMFGTNSFDINHPKLINSKIFLAFKMHTEITRTFTLLYMSISTVNSLWVLK